MCVPRALAEREREREAANARSHTPRIMYVKKQIADTQKRGGGAEEDRGS